LAVDANTYIASVKERITYANKIREKLGNEALAALAVSAIRAFRRAARVSSTDHAEEVVSGEALDVSKPAEPKATPAEGGDLEDEELPIPSQAYIVRQFKRPEEIALLRSVYGKQFILISAYTPEDLRRRKIEEFER